MLSSRKSQHNAILELAQPKLGLGHSLLNLGATYLPYLVALVQFSDMSRYEFFSLLKESFVDSFVSWLRESVETWDMDGID
ncbi:hypothetical protein OUZ56_019296 [Daphnia magna]|uniref:Uncharacterized protein n=1 Tax=Daphnia magna TaxID=35525 RepID=A0ABQ9ZBU1_9CRUS|nr:hypothetical protein OUZ56_019296 [Daphnia magna]